MIRIMFDSTTPDAIPAGAELVATYADGRYAVPEREVRARWPRAALIRTCVTGDHGVGDCLDVETGDATPADTPAWIAARHAAGIEFVTIYANRSTMPAVEEACRKAGVGGWWKWVATLDGSLNVGGFAPFTGPAAVQALGAAAAGVNVDVSFVYEDGWHPTRQQVLAVTGA